jgi:hypothetical protein
MHSSWHVDGFVSERVKGGRSGLGLIAGGLGYLRKGYLLLGIWAIFWDMDLGKEAGLGKASRFFEYSSYSSSFGNGGYTVSAILFTVYSFEGLLR